MAAVGIMSDSELMDMGISAVGNRVKVRTFCKGDSMSKDDKRSEMKRKLAEIMNLSKSRRLSETTKRKAAQPSALRKATLKCEIRCKHYVKGFGYKIKRSEKGG